MARRLVRLGELRLLVTWEGGAEPVAGDVIRYVDDVNSRSPLRGLVEVYVFADAQSMESHIEAKAASVGAVMAARGMLSYHEAWTGIPALYFCREVAETHGPGMLRALVHHETAHALLHGALTYYALPADVEWGDLSVEEAYLLFSGVKDYEVSLALRKMELGEYQAPLVDYHVREATPDVTLVKTILQLLPLLDLFGGARRRLVEVAREAGLSSHSLTTLSELMSSAGGTLERLAEAVEWYRSCWPRARGFKQVA